jgi:hypothetical protein
VDWRDCFTEYPFQNLPMFYFEGRFYVPGLDNGELPPNQRFGLARLGLRNARKLTNVFNYLCMMDYPGDRRHGEPRQGAKKIRLWQNNNFAGRGFAVNFCAIKKKSDWPVL